RSRAGGRLPRLIPALDRNVPLVRACPPLACGRDPVLPGDGVVHGARRGALAGGAERPLPRRRVPRCLRDADLAVPDADRVRNVSGAGTAQVAHLGQPAHGCDRRLSVGGARPWPSPVQRLRRELGRRDPADADGVVVLPADRARVRRHHLAVAIRVGWATSAWRHGPTYRSMPEPVAMRAANIGRWINRHRRGLRSELYRPSRRYDVVVFVKAMDAAAQAEAARIQNGGGRVVFDANVNYYEIWGDYELPNTRPTDEQQVDALAMTQLADWVVADSSYLLQVVRRRTDRASWIPDNVDIRLFRPPRQRTENALRVVWSGMAAKARPLLDLADALVATGAELIV